MKKPLILLVDIDPPLLDSLSEWLNSYGYPVLTADNPFKALNLLYHYEIKILIAEYNLPEMDGLELMKRGRFLLPGLAAVLIGCKTDLPLAVSALKEGASDFLEKPFCPERLKIILDKITQQQTLLAENRKLKKEQANKAGKTSTLQKNPFSLEEMEKQMFIQALAVSGGNRSRAAKLLGISRPTFYGKLKKYGACQE